MKKQIGVIIFVMIVLVGIFLIGGYYSYVKKPVCGNGIVEKNETSENCCVDIGCSEGYECEDNECVIIVENNNFGLTEEEMGLIEEIMIRDYPEVLEESELSVANKVPHSNWIQLTYVPIDNNISSSYATIIIDLERKRIISIDGSWGGTSNPVCCFGLTFNNENYAKNAGYMNCTIGECKTSPTDEDEQSWICPKFEHINCMPSIMSSMVPYCGTPYGDWIKENCPENSFSY